MNRDTLLIVDDIEMNRALLRGCFDECYNILEAENGQQAIEILKRHTVNIVITDIFMPIIDGFELTKQIKQDILLQNLPVIVITDRGEEFEMRALKSGADDFINKPFRKELLQHRVDSVLSQQCYSKNYSLRPFPYSHIKLPFAIVKLENDSHVAHYQYVNETFAAECRTEKENMLENVNDIHSAEFCEFLRNTDGKDGFCQKTFFVPEQNDYFDVVAYAQRVKSR